MAASANQSNTSSPVEENNKRELKIQDLRGVFLKEHSFVGLKPKHILGGNQPVWNQYEFYIFGGRFGWQKKNDFNSFATENQAIVDLNSNKQYKVLGSLMNILEFRDEKLKLNPDRYYLGRVYYFTVDQVEFAIFRLGNQTLTLYRSPGTEGHWLPLTEDRLRELGRKGYLDLSKLGYKTHKIKGTTEHLVEITKLDPKVEVRIIQYDKLTRIDDILNQLSLTRQSNPSGSDQKKDKVGPQQDKNTTTPTSGGQNKDRATPQQDKNTPVPASGDQKKESDKASIQQERSGATDQRLDKRQTSGQSQTGKSSDQKLEKPTEKEKSYQLYREGERMQYDKSVSPSPDQKLEVQPSEKEKDNVGTTTQPVVSQDQIEQAKQYLREIGMRESQISLLMIGYQQLLIRGNEVRLEQYLAYVESIQSTPEEFGPKFRSALEQLLKDIRNNSIKTSSGFIKFMETGSFPQSKSDNTQSQTDDNKSNTNQETQILIDKVENIIQQIYGSDLITERRNEIIQRINRLTPNEVKALLEIISKLDKLKEIDREVLLDIIANPDGVNMEKFETIATQEGEINQELRDFYHLVRLFYEDLTEQQYLGMMKYYFRGE